LIVDDDPLDRELVESVLSRAGHSTQSAVDGESALELLAHEPFDVALVDLSMGGMGGLATLRAIRHSHPDLRMVVVSGHDDREHVLGAVSAGADGYVLKLDVPYRLSQALDEVNTGGGPMSTRIARIVLEELRCATEEARATAETASETERSLSQREWDVLDRLSTGDTYAQIGANLNISVNTVRHHIRNLYDKLQVTGKAQAITRAMGRRPV
jgi:DNA-binding NarL/FixJ family response regulator